MYDQRGQEDYENQRGQGITKYPGDPKRLRRFKRIRGGGPRRSGGFKRIRRTRRILEDQGDPRGSVEYKMVRGIRGLLEDQGNPKGSGDTRGSGGSKWIRGIQGDPGDIRSTVASKEIKETNHQEVPGNLR